MTKQALCLQDTFAPHNRCFGCGPANSHGLQLKSFVDNEETRATWQAQPYHEAFPGILCGGIIGTLLDCHSNWSAAYFLMQQQGLNSPPCTVTAFYHVSLKRPTPSQVEVRLVAKLKDLQKDRALIIASLYSTLDKKICATSEGLFVAVKETHPAFHRW